MIYKISLLANVTVFDINASMLKVGEARAQKLGHTQEFICII